MTIRQFLPTEQELYENFVAANSSGSFLQSWSWGEFQSTQHKKPIRYGIFDGAKTLGTVQLFKTKVPHLPGYYLYAPYGPIIPAEGIHELVKQIGADYPDAWFIRFEPKQQLDISGHPTVHIQPGKTSVLDLSHNLEDLQKAMHNKTRYNIGVANKHSIMVEQNSDSDSALNLLAQTSKRQGFHSYPASYYEDLVTFFNQNPNSDSSLKLYQAKYQDRVIASAIMLDHGSTRTYLFGGSDNEYRQYMAPYALHWQAIGDAKTAGLKLYDWWGIETATGKVPGFVQFKIRWGGEERLYPPALDLVQNKAWYSIYKLLRKLNRLF